MTQNTVLGTYTWSWGNLSQYPVVQRSLGGRGAWEGGWSPDMCSSEGSREDGTEPCSSTLLTLRRFSTVPRVVVTRNHKIIFVAMSVTNVILLLLGIGM